MVLIYCTLGGGKFKMSLTELKSRCQQRWLRHNPLLSLFQCVEAFQAVWLIAFTFIFKVIICSVCMVSHFLPRQNLQLSILCLPLSTFNICLLLSFLAIVGPTRQSLLTSSFLSRQPHLQEDRSHGLGGI